MADDPAADGTFRGAKTGARTSTKLLNSTLAGRTQHGTQTVVRGGVLVTKAFKTSDKPFVTTTSMSDVYGKINTIVNPPNKDRAPTTKTAHSLTAVTVQSAGTVHKRSVPYHPEAPRNRLKMEPKRDPPPFAITYKPTIGIINQKRKGDHYRTVASITQAAASVPMTARLGFTNDGIMAGLTKRLHAQVLDDGRRK